MVAPIIINVANGIFVWNLSQDVGKGRPNLPDDVELVRFAYFCSGINAKNNIMPPADKEIASKIPLNGPFDATLEGLIRRQQARIGGVQDGKVSTIKHASGMFNGQTWLMMPLNVNMMDVVGNLWPRIDLHHATSALLTQKIKNVFSLPKT